MIKEAVASIGKKTLSEASSSPTALAHCHALRPQWLAQIVTNRQQVSDLMNRLLANESLNSSLPSPPLLTEPAPALTILDRLQIQQENLLHVISNLIVTSSSSQKEIEESATHHDVSKPDLIQWLKEKGYISLAEKLESHTGYPWTEFEKIRSPILIEQLVDIYLLCQHKEMADKDTQKLVEFALHFAHIATSSNLRKDYARSYEIVNDVKQVLGQLIYLVNQDPLLAIQTIHAPHYQGVLEGIKDAFNSQIQEICEKLQNHYLAHLATQLQDPEIALYTKIPVEISKALLTDIGTINVGIIDALSDIFLSQESRPLNHEINLSHALTLLQRSPRLRAEFEKIHSPRSMKTPSKYVIEATLGLSPHASISQKDARLTALIAILSHLRQGGDRSCFAVSLAIEILSAHLGLCFKDLRQLLEEGKLTRRIKRVRKDIPFTTRINDDNLHKEIIFNLQGELIVHQQKKAPLWEAPGLLAACQAIGLENPRAAIMTLIHHLSPLPDGTYKMEMRTLLEKLCEQASSTQTSTMDHLYCQACFAFSSQTSQPLLKIWENAIANMAEAEEGSMIKTAILESTLDTLQFKLGELQIPPSLLLQRFFLSIQKTLYEWIHLQYDPTIMNPSESGVKGIEGGFILYHQKQKIDHEKSFRLFLLDILQDVNRKMRKEMTSDTDIQQLNEVLETLSSFIDTEEFMGFLLVRYHPANKHAVSQLAHGHPINYEHLHFTPWLTQTGNDSKTLLKIYLEAEKPIQGEKFIVSGAEEALANIIEMCKRMSEEEKQLYLNNPNKLKPLCILGKHRLPFMAGNPSLAKAWQQECPTKTWIEQFVLAPGRQIAETVIDPETKQNLLFSLENHLLAQHISPENVEEAQKKTQAILARLREIPESLTLKQYRHKILDICQEIHPFPTQALINKLTREIDTTLCQSLAPHLKKMLEDSAVHFADTNWCNGIQDLHFCFAVNPGTGELELWEACANGSHLMALDQNYWLFNQKWEFLTIPTDLIPDDSLYLSSS
jgi:hypothetical protein